MSDLDTTVELHPGKWCPHCKQYCYFDDRQPVVTGWAKVRRTSATVVGFTSVLVFSFLAAIGALVIGSIVLLNMTL